MTSPHDRTQANCRAAGDGMFVQGAAQHLAKRVCASCPIKVTCLAEALDNQIEYGVWGGLTERERRRLLRQRPNVTSWSALLDQLTEDADALGRAGDHSLQPAV